MKGRDGTVAIVGRPNAGKSTLVNALVGKKVAIVSPRPQTTRHRLRGVLRRDGARIVFIDTPGTHRPLHRMNRAMMDAVRSGLSRADVVVLAVEADDRGGGGLEFLFDLVRDLPTPKVLVLTKIDRVRKEKLLPAIARWSKEMPFAAVVPVAAPDGDGLEPLVSELSKLLPEVDEIPPTDPPEPPVEFEAAERIREALLVRCGEELPYTTAVRVDGITPPERPGATTRVVATIVVDRPGQKKIVVGAGGKMIRDIGSDARRQIETIVGGKVFLDLLVVVEEGWREDARFLAGLPRPDDRPRGEKGGGEGDPEGGFPDAGPDGDDLDEDPGPPPADSDPDRDS